MSDLTIIIPTFHSKKLTDICIRSFVKFCPPDINLFFIVIENSSDISYKTHIESLADNIQWINNNRKVIGSEANASALEIGIQQTKTDLVFTAHCDTCVTSEEFYKSILSKYNKGNKAVGMLHDKHPQRIKALHILGLLTEKRIIQKVDLYPKYIDKIQVMDVGDSITEYCRSNNIPYYNFDNTYNTPSLIKAIEPKYGRLNDVARCISEKGNVIYMHLARGILKTQKIYVKKNRINLEEWIKFCNNILE